MTKLKAGFYGITGCAGCLLSIVFNEKELLSIADIVDIKAFPFIKNARAKARGIFEYTRNFRCASEISSCIKKKEESRLDIVFMEGLVASKDDLMVLKEIRAKTKVLVALGACACTGGVPAFRNFIQRDDYQRLVFHKRMSLEDQEPTPIDKHVKVEHYLPGCPPDKKEILTFIKDIALGKKPKRYDKPVCFECRLNKNACFLDKNELCLGPITNGNCNSVCINGGLVCWGCRGPTPDANIDTLINLLHEKGIDIVNISERMKAFVGLKLPEEEKKDEQDNKT